MEYSIYIMVCIILGLVVSNTSFLIQLTLDRVCNKRKQKDDAKYKGHYACKKCGNSMDFNTKVLPKYCPFCGEKYGEK